MRDLDDEPTVIALLSQGEGVARALRDAGYAFGGPELAASATVVIVDAPGDVTAAVRDVRRIARLDAAIVTLLEGNDAWASRAADAQAAGAFASLATPPVAADIAAVVATASAPRRWTTRIADRFRSIDLEDHLVSLGHFTAGLLHELKNPLAVTQMNVNLLRDELGPLLEARDHLRRLIAAEPAERDARAAAAAQFLERTDANASEVEDIVADARLGLDRMLALLTRLHDFARGHEATLERADVSAIVADVAKDLEGVEVEVVAERPLFASVARPFLDTLVDHLATNAAQAARALAHPRVRFDVYADGDRVVVAVRDNGPGIPVELHDRIFEPFFTVRREAGRAGLGLALCREYATLMGADLSVWSVPGRGACFRIHLVRD